MFDAKRVKDELIKWIKEYFEQNGRDSEAVIGISGGKDSSVIAALCVEALGGERVLGVLMPQGKQSDIESSYDICRHLGISYILVSIEDAVSSTLGSISASFLNDMAYVNTPARIRTAILYAISGSIGGRVANTCNLSENYIGYVTKYGDGAGDFSPLANLTVQEVKAVGREVGVPDRLIDKVPLDGLCGSTDEDSFGFTYEQLDRYIRTGECESEDLRSKIDTMHRNNRHKLTQMPSYKLQKNMV